ncbi:hypothetical protein R1flu_000064 [Riccia fluitans]|uniref:Protein FAR1-RELATED SEQUENCE n=1 Tax=Riccia fluitans TaxID=41844 RepID=A0ABD1XZD1_9MARC
MEEYMKKRVRSSARCGCLAMIQIEQKFVYGTEKWQVIKHVLEHNHDLLTSVEVRCLPAYRLISEEERRKILKYMKAGLRTSDMISLVHVEAAVELTFTHVDVKNFLLRASVVDQGCYHDATEVLKTLKDKCDRDSDFFFDFTVDEEGRLENLLWVHNKAKSAAGRFGDVVVFDTSYQLNQYQMQFGFFVGINNHGQSILTGAGLLWNEIT